MYKNGPCSKIVRHLNQWDLPALGALLGERPPQANGLGMVRIAESEEKRENAT